MNGLRGFVVLGIGMIIYPLFSGQAIAGESLVLSDKMFMVSVDYGQSVRELAKTNYDSVGMDVTEDKFQTSRTGNRTVEMHLIHFYASLSSREIMEELNARGLRPAELCELLEFGIANSNEQRKYSIISLGSVYKVFGVLSAVPSLRQEGRKRVVRVDLRPPFFDQSCGFLAVRK